MGEGAATYQAVYVMYQEARGDAGVLLHDVSTRAVAQGKRGRGGNEHGGARVGVESDTVRVRVRVGSERVWQAAAVAERQQRKFAVR